MTCDPQSLISAARCIDRVIPPGRQRAAQVALLCAWASNAQPGPGPCTLPTAPVDLGASAGDSEVTLTWPAGAGATGYNIKRALVTGGPYATIGTSATSPYVDHTAVNGTEYFYVVSSTNACGESAGNSVESHGTPGLLPPNKAITPNPSDGSSATNPINPVLSWSNGGGATSYNVYFNGVFQGNQAGTTFSPGVLAGTTGYTWRIDSVNASGTTTGDLWTFTTIVLFAWTPASIPVSWDDANGSFYENLATFYATADIPTVSSIYYLNPGNITGMTGFDGLPALTDLDLSDQNVVSLDCTGATSLVNLYCNNNLPGLTSLIVSGCTALTYLDCTANPALASLNCTGLSSLATINCYSCALTTLTLAGCTALAYLDCNTNSLTTLDVSTCTALAYLDCDTNSLTTLDVSTCTALTTLICYLCALTTLTLTGCTALTTLDCDTNSLTTLDVSTCTALTTLICNHQYSAGIAVLVDLRIGNSTNYSDVEANDNALPASPHGVDEVLNLLATNCLANSGFCDLDAAATNAPPTGGVLNADYIALTGAGWTVNIN